MQKNAHKRPPLVRHSWDYSWSLLLEVTASKIFDKLNAMETDKNWTCENVCSLIEVDRKKWDEIVHGVHCDATTTSTKQIAI